MPGLSNCPVNGCFIQTLKQLGRSHRLAHRPDFDGGKGPRAVLRAVDSLPRAHFPQGMVGWMVGTGLGCLASWLHIPPPSVSSPADTSMLSSPCPRDLRSPPSKPSEAWALEQPPAAQPGTHLALTLRVQPGEALGSLHWLETNEGREDPLHHQPPSSNPFYCIICQEGILRVLPKETLRR